ncbi:ATPase family protein associated with various cellular activities (AAA) [Opitutaceae bacterium TAV1]|nr:ATPase family protein associated with various cellular activities (AAA) [Opitutaceae bacterium TAV1]
MQSTKNHLSAAPVSKAQIYDIIDDYFNEGNADLSFEVTADDVRKHMTREIEALTTIAKGTTQALESAQAALKVARDAQDLAARKSGGTFTVEIKSADRPTVKVENPHRQLAGLLAIIAAGCNAYLAGPAGSGKTTAAEQVAGALKLPFHFTGAVATEWQLTGFVDAGGKYHSTPFRKWAEEGGVFLWDEIDASDARALLRFNATLANGICEFPDGQIVRLHKTCVAIAAANTFGQGADRQYVGRNQLDAASLDRFVFLGWEYDEELEMRIAGNLEWTRRVQAIRHAVETLKIRAVVSPRASIYGARLLAQGMDVATVETLTVWKGMDAATVAKVKAQIAES